MRTARGSAGRLALSPVQATSAAASRGCRLCASDCAACADANPRPPCAAPAQEVSRRGLVALAAACLAASEAWAGQAGATSPEVVDAVEAGIEVYDAAFSLSLLALQGSVQQSWVQEFKQLLGSPHTVRLKNKPQLKDLYANLESGDVRGVDLVSVGDTWMGIAISQGLIRPFRKAEKYRLVALATSCVSDDCEERLANGS
ncbi:unnamed protein product [Ostreobium quekettii]|uniref:Uncharacterized protein n=1 Tax=Ostreobium quekettii TaxID=121088 RepID=A0A8S1IV77_9CHLO|nr:unnamed protein product [Ostreobium quekettii]|eukprot:evm.model.scf_1016.5 EVM.evm.TU.scf_1016.5   scf_1016:23561-24489(+)